MLRHQTSAPKRRRVPQKRGFQFLLSLLFLLPHAFAGTDTVGNAGLVENQFVYVWVNLARYLNVCTQASDCAARVGLSESESAVLRALRATVNSGGVSPLKPLHFAPDRGQGSDPWSAVLSLSPSGFAVIHSRALYSDSEAVRAGGALHESLPYLTVAAGLLTEKPAPVAWTLGLKLRSFWSRKGQVLSASSFGLNHFYFQTVDGAPPETAGLWLVSDADQMHDLTPLLLQQLPCASKDSRRLLILNRNVDWVGQAADTGSLRQVKARGEVTFSCDSRQARADFELVLTTQANRFLVERSFVQITGAR